MKQKLKIFINYLQEHINREQIISLKEFNAFIAVWIATISLKKNLKNAEQISFNFSTFEEDFSLEIKLIKERYPKLIDSFYDVINRIDAVILKKAYEKLLNAYEKIDEDYDDIISWSYQIGKRETEKAAFKKIGANKEKIQALDLLYTTQFFTDKYMVKYLVEESIPSDILASKLQIIDPASGGGNFLMYSFEVLFDRYRKQKPNWPDQKIVDTILQKSLIGYDLDSSLSSIASLSLFTKACYYAVPSQNIQIRIFGGLDGDILGFLNSRIESDLIAGFSFQQFLEQPQKNISRIFLTNPPFMGKRDMDLKLKDYLTKNYPQSKADLCVTFLQRLIESMGSGDTLGIVAQNSWMYLSSLKDFRNLFLRNQLLRQCVDLGTNAFEDINGEKTNVGLFIIGRSRNNTSNFFNLRNKPRAEKKKILSGRCFQATDGFYIDQNKFFQNKGLEFNYHMEDRFNVKDLPNYGDFGKPMQGSSTGDNTNFVKFTWEVFEDKNWVRVSKGGGYSKWAGLNYYSVLWGENGSAIKKNPGSALRNVDKIPLTQLVFSDTGTLGLNVRVLKPGQLFIASGPGIQVINGDVYAHLAFLNSKISSFLLKILNPKFTISAGYIARIPVVREILFSEKISQRSYKCVKLKDEYLTTKIPNDEFKHAEYSSISNVNEYLKKEIAKDLKNDFERLYLEYKIEKEIREFYNFNQKELEEIKCLVGESTFNIHKSDKDISIEQLDLFLSNSIDINCQIVSRSLNGYKAGSESLLESLAHNFNCSPKQIFAKLVENVDSLKKTLNKYKDDFVHKLMLFELGVLGISKYVCKIESLTSLEKQISDKYAFIDSSLLNKTKIRHLIDIHHKTSFFNKPLVNIDGTNIIIGKKNG